MKKIDLFIVVLFLMFGGVLHAATNAPSRDVLAHASGQWSWFAQVSRIPGIVPTDVPGSNEQTDIFSLQNAPGQQWKSLASIPGRAVALAARSSQLAVLMTDGTWLTLWEDGSATGQPLPADGQIKALTDDGSHLWAIGSVVGGIEAAKQAIARDEAVTQPTTSPTDILSSPSPATEPLVGMHILRSSPAKMVIFQEQNGRWATVAELPPDAMLTADDEISLVLQGDLPLVSLKTGAGVLRTLEFTADHQWKDIIRPLVDPSVVNFRILSDGFNPLLWWTTGNNAGEISLGGPTDGIKPLEWVGKDQLEGLPTAMLSGGYLCVLGPRAGKVLEQRYKLDGTPYQAAAELTVASDLNETLLPRWLEVVFLTSMGFSVGASVFRQWAEPEKRQVVKLPVPAQLLPRVAAGLLDALPVIGAVFYLGIRTDAFDDLDKIPTLQAIIIISSAVVFYILHTTIVETLTGRSAGKWVFGLKVVTLEGAAATKSQLMIRNLLRVIDPLVMIIISPQRQRSADAVAGTMVVPLVPLPDPPEDFGDQD